VPKGETVAGNILVLDTSAIIALVQDITTARDNSTPAFAGVLGDNEIIIPRVVLDELNDLKKEGGDIGTTALEAARQLERYSVLGSLIDGVETEKGGVLRIAPRPDNAKISAWGLNPRKGSHEVLATVIELDDELSSAQKRQETDPTSEMSDIHSVKLVTQDRILRVLARSVYNVVAEELMSVCAPELSDEPGFTKVEVEPAQLDQILDTGFYQVKESPSINGFFHIVDKENPKVRYCYGLVREAGLKRIELIDRAKVDFLKVAGEVAGRNVRQKLLLWALMGCGEPDPMAPGGVRLITASGPAGSGKSFLTLAAAWERLERGHFDRIVVTRPMVDVGTSLGFLPGTLEEKLRPWGGALEDNLRAIVQMPSPDDGRSTSGKRNVQRNARPFDVKTWLEMENRLELIPLTYIRGRTFRRSFVILEEAQNIARGPLKVLLTRLGEGSIVVVVGDSSQIDNQFLSRRNNGLVHAVNAFRTWPQAVHVHLRQIVRSDLAEAASNLL